MKPILFSTEMVKALLRGEKSQTRREVKNKVALDWLDTGFTPKFVALPENGLSKYQVGDVLWVRETWIKIDSSFGYKALLTEEEAKKYHWKPSIFMPKEAARIFLKVISVRVERLQNISEEDAITEGIDQEFGTFLDLTPVDSYHSLWEKINGNGSWEKNPWVWVYSFEKT